VERHQSEQSRQTLCLHKLRNAHASCSLHGVAGAGNAGKAQVARVLPVLVARQSMYPCRNYYLIHVIVLCLSLYPL
jgi:hypothetical protein